MFLSNAKELIRAGEGEDETELERLKASLPLFLLCIGSTGRGTRGMRGAARGGAAVLACVVGLLMSLFDRRRLVLPASEMFLSSCSPGGVGASTEAMLTLNCGWRDSYYEGRQIECREVSKQDILTMMKVVTIMNDG